MTIAAEATPEKGSGGSAGNGAEKPDGCGTVLRTPGELRHVLAVAALFGKPVQPTEADGGIVLKTVGWEESAASEDQIPG